MFAQETLAGWIGNYLTRSSGIKVLFESAIVPKWNDGVISFQNVFVSRRPGQGKSGVQKGSAAAAAAAAAQSDLTRLGLARHDEEEDTNYTQFDLSIDTVNVTLSFAKWFNGRGLLRNVEVKGVRGIVDRTDIHALDHYVDPKSYRHEHQPGDFEIDSFRLDDLLVTVHQPNQFRPFSVSIFSCDLPRLRKQWLFYDFLSANNVSGSFDESLFTIHPRQTHSRTGAQLQQGIEERSETPWKKHSRLRIDGLNIDHLNRGVGGAFSWIREGNVDVVADVMFPLDNDESFVRMMSELYEKVEATVTSTGILGDTQTPDESSTPSPEPVQIEQPQDTHQRFMIMDFRVNLNDVRASVPLLTKDLSYVNNALIRPIVAYINSRHTYIPINCRLVKRMGDFDGSWTLYDSGMMESLSAEMYEAFAQNVLDEQARKRRIKQVGLWSLQLAAQALFVGMAGSIA